MSNRSNRPARAWLSLAIGTTLALATQLPASAASGNRSEPRGRTPRISFDNIADRLDGFRLSGFSFMPGVAVIDYDNDTFLDLYVVNGKGQPNALFRNNHNGTFTDVAAQAGVADLGQGTGLAVGDINNISAMDPPLATGSIPTMGPTISI
jgi:hypothetical protein